MTTVRRLKAVSAVLAMAAIATCAHVWGEPTNDKTKSILASRNHAPAATPVERQFTEDLAATKFTDRNIILYQTRGGELLFGLQVQPPLEADKTNRPRDLVILVDTAASQVRGPLHTARQLAESLVNAARPEDRVAIWTVNTPAATQNLTRGLEPAKSAKVQDALKALAREVPFGSNDLKNALEKAVASFDNREGRQRVIIFLGSGKSLLSPLANADRDQLCEKMLAREIGFFPVPLGINLDPINLHGLATGTGGLLVRQLPETPLANVVEKLIKAIATPVLYPTKVQMPAEVVEFYPTKLPPLRPDSPTLVIGKIKPTAKFAYTVEGTVAGRPVPVRTTLDLPTPELDNFFLIGMVEQWKAGERKEAAAPFRADRLLAMSFERARLQRDEFNAQGHWALDMDRLDVAAQMFDQARKIDPNDAEADAALKIIDKMKKGQLTKQDLRNALGRPENPAIRIQKQGNQVKVDRDRMDRMVALAAAPEDKMENQAPAVAAAPADQEPLLRLQQQRQAVEEQRITGIVNEAERQARRILPNDPEAAHDILKRTLASVRDNPELSPLTRQNLVNRLENALRNVDIQGARIKRDLEERLRLEADARARIAAIDERARGEEQTRRRILAINELLNTGRIEQAHFEALALQADTIARGAPVQPTMVAGEVMGINAIHQREQQEVRRASEEKYLLTMLQVDKSHIPFPDEPPVGFPPAAIWRELTKRRQLAGYDSVGLGEDQSSRNRSKALNEKLSKPVNLDKGIDPNTPLKDALEFLADRYDLTIIIDSKAFEAIGVQKVEEQPVQLPKMIGVSMATVLRLLLAQVKGELYSGTYLVRRDFIEVSTTYNAAAEKVVRAYPVADLVIGIPNSVNLQALNQSLQVFGQVQQQANPLLQGGMGFGFPGIGFPGMIGANPFAPPPAPGAANPLGGPQNPFGFGALGVGNNQFGNLGGQFGLQGADSSYELMQLIVTVVAPGEWINLPPDPNNPNQAGAAGANALLGQGGAGGGAGGMPVPQSVSQELLNSIGYYRPAHALVVRASSRIHAQLEGGVFRAPGAAPMGMGAAGNNRDGVIVFNGKDNPAPKPAPKDVKVAAIDPKKPKPAPPEMDPKAAWQEALVKLAHDPAVNHPRLVIATTDLLVSKGKYDHAAEFLKAQLRLGFVTRPWVYDLLGEVLQLSGGSPDEIERAQVSAVDLVPQDARGYLRAAKAMSELKRYDRAVAFCKMAALLEPNLADSYANALVYAGESKDSQAMAWAASQLLRQEWPADNDELHERARVKLHNLAKVLERDLRRTEAERMLAAVQQVQRRDLVVHAKWQGEADFDLEVKEPIGTVCSFLNKQTPAGGTLLADDLARLNHKSYVAAEAFSGDYEIAVKRVWGRPLGNKVSLEIIRHQGTPQERIEIHTIVFDRNSTVKITLDSGRRTVTASVPPPAAVKEPEREGKPANPDRVLNRLRAMTDTGVMEMSGLRGGVTSTGTTRPRMTVDSRPALPTPASQVTYQRVGAFVNNALDLTAQTTVVPEKNEIRIKLNPVFQTGGRGQTLPTNPLIPGGF